MCARRVRRRAEGESGGDWAMSMGGGREAGAVHTHRPPATPVLSDLLLIAALMGGSEHQPLMSLFG